MSRAASRDRSREFGRDLPDDLPSENDLVHALFQNYDRQALEFLVEDTIIYLLPFCAAKDGLGGFIQDADSYETRPTEFTGTEVRDLLSNHVPREVSLNETPAWLLTETDWSARVSWHARVRWAERIEPVATPATDIKDAWENGLQVGVPRGYGRYHPPSDAVVVYVGPQPDNPTVITTIWSASGLRSNEDVNAEHLRRCDVCTGLWNPGQTEVCCWCGAPARRSHRPRLMA